MAPTIRLIVLFAAVVYMTCALALPVPFVDVEKAWKEGRTERDIHAAALATPSFFHEATTRTAEQTRVSSRDSQAFESALDERSMAARVAKRGLTVVASVQDFMDRFMFKWLREGGLEERGLGDEDEAPVLRPRRGRRWEF